MTRCSDPPYTVAHRSRLALMAPVGLVAVAVLTAPPVSAQENVWPSNADAHPGEIVYSRDVPYGTATRRFSQGEANTVAPDQSVLINDSLRLGLQPMTDAEQAEISAPLTRGMDLVRDQTQVALSHITGRAEGSDFTRSESGASSAGGIVVQGLSVLPSALGAVSRALGGGE